MIYEAPVKTELSQEQIDYAKRFLRENHGQEVVMFEELSSYFPKDDENWKPWSGVIKACLNPAVFEGQARMTAMAMKLNAELLRQFKAGESVDNYLGDFKLSRCQIDKMAAKVIMGVDSIFGNCTLFDDEVTLPTKATEFFLGEFPESNKRDCLLLGDTGRGKTWATIAYVCSKATWNRYTRQISLSAKYIKAFELSHLIHKKDFKALDELKRFNYLIVDELGSEPEGYKGKDFVAFFENLYGDRHMQNKATFLITNHEPDVVKEVYGERFVSRFNETGLTKQIVDLDWRSIVEDGE